mmetsp:Transcript_22042/g.42801  ORF Transcript_22042/g.42801 Transcript_22042/m.42801 type:complete len:449 (-) Transcript_22042:168-1514(-)
MINRKKTAPDPEQAVRQNKNVVTPSRGGSTLRSIFIKAAIALVMVGLIFFMWSKPAKNFAVVIDAGSTGSRIHVYEFHTIRGVPKLKDELFVQLKPGLSSYASKPSEGASSLKPLLARALEKIPAAHLPHTPVMIGATAGLRMLPGSQADDLLRGSRDLLRSDYTFKPFEDDAVSIMSGDNEGKFAWLAVNMLTGKLGGNPSETVGVIDLGGGSVQMMRALEPSISAAAPPGYVLESAWQTKKYNLFVHSFLGYGLMAGRLAVLEQEGAAADCIPHGAHGTYKYNKEEVDASGSPSGSDFARCHLAAVKALNIDKPCGASSGCAFDGGWGAKESASDTEFYLLSYLYERIEQSGAGQFEPEEGIGTSSVSELERAAKNVCSKSIDQLKAAPDMHPEDPVYFCLDLVYIHALLSVGFGIESGFKMAKKFDINSVKYEAAWSLGAALELL